jgi:hypothetical protein
MDLDDLGDIDLDDADRERNRIEDIEIPGAKLSDDDIELLARLFFRMAADDDLNVAAALFLADAGTQLRGLASYRDGQFWLIYQALTDPDRGDDPVRGFIPPQPCGVGWPV